MSKRPIVILGETLIDFSPSQASPVKLRLGYEGYPGGAPANVAVALRQLGIPTRLITKVGDDVFGHCINEALEAYGVDVSSVRMTSSARTGITFVSLSEGGERSFSFFCDGSADQRLAVSEIEPVWIEEAALFHYGTFTLAHEPSRTTTLRAVEWARDAGVPVSIDVNLRLEVWESLAQARDMAQSAIAASDIVKMTLEEASLIFTKATGSTSALEEILRLGPKLAVVTGGADGGLYATQDLVARYAGVPAEPLDTTGAGDAFMAALLSKVAGIEWKVSLAPSALRRAFEYASTAGALATEQFGAMSAMPGSRAIASRLRQREAYSSTVQEGSNARESADTLG